MARDIAGKLAAGETLDDDDVKYAVDRGIALPEDYDTQVAQFTALPGEGGPIVQTGPAFPSSAGQGQVQVVVLDFMTKAELASFAEEYGLEVDQGDTKPEMMKAIAAQLNSEEPEGSGEEDSGGGGGEGE
jgi:hypothetical protein